MKCRQKKMNIRTLSIGILIIRPETQRRMIDMLFVRDMWEYMTLARLPDIDELNRLGNDGWELCSLSSNIIKTESGDGGEIIGHYTVLKRKCGEAYVHKKGKVKHVTGD